MKKLLLILLIFPVIYSCQGKEIKANTKNTEQEKIVKKDTVEFISYWDKNDQNNFVVKKKDAELTLLVVDFIKHNFNKGDILEILWDDSETDFPVFMSAKKIKEGPLSEFLKKNNIRLQYTWKSQFSGVLFQNHTL